MWLVDGAWGRFEKTTDQTRLTVLDGALSLKALELPYYAEVSRVTVDGTDIDFTFQNGKLCFEAEVKHSLTVCGKDA